MFLMYKYCKYIRNKVNFTITGLRYCNKFTGTNIIECVYVVEIEMKLSLK